jgi:hypothetical protein
MSDPFYRSPAWRRLRAACLERQPTCATPGCGRASVAADHIVPRSKGGADTLANLRGLCLQCHNQRRQGGEPRAKGCDAAGNPRDLRHWWNADKSLRAGGLDRLGAQSAVSSDPGRSRGRR